MLIELFKIPKMHLHVLNIGNLRYDVWVSNGQLCTCGGENELVQQICNVSATGKVVLKVHAKAILNEYLFVSTKPF